MTEDDAKGKWCPFARDSNTAGNRVRYGSGGDETQARQYGHEAAMEFPCIGSACMAWRVTPDPTNGWDRDDRDRHREQGRSFGGDGYCGLAGAPS